MSIYDPYIRFFSFVDPIGLKIFLFSVMLNLMLLLIPALSLENSLL